MKNYKENSIFFCFSTPKLFKTCSKISKKTFLRVNFTIFYALEDLHIDDDNDEVKYLLRDSYEARLIKIITWDFIIH